MIRISVAARSDAVRAKLETWIRSSTSVELAEMLDAASLSLSSVSGDVLLIEVENPTDHNFPSLADLPIPVLVLLDAGDSALVSTILRSGIHGAISDDATAEELESAVHALHAGLVVTTPASLAALLPEPVLADHLPERLSERELEVLELIAEGLSNKTIAHRLNISEHTVKTHVASIFSKLGSSSRTEAVSQAIRRGLVML